MAANLLWSIILLLVGVFVAVLEAVLPSGGILAIAALGLLGGSLYCAYQLSGATMALVAIVEAAVVPTAIVLAFKWLPRTAMGRELMLSAPKSNPKSHGMTTDAAPHESASLLGSTGRAVTMLRPSGTVELDGKRISVVTHGEMLAEGTTVKVVHVEGNRVVVEAVRA